MTQLTLNPGQVQQLHAGSSLVECRDSTGNLVGFLHLAGRNGLVPIPDISADQLAEYERESGGRSLADILTDLRQRR
jgi:hypothetical protein